MWDALSAVGRTTADSGRSEGLAQGREIVFHAEQAQEPSLKTPFEQSESKTHSYPQTLLTGS